MQIQQRFTQFLLPVEIGLETVRRESRSTVCCKLMNLRLEVSNFVMFEILKND